jgi:Ca2+-binding RTX toxin-like protein
MGRDRIRGLGGDDFIDGEEGGDTVWGGDGRDTIYGDTGTDTLYGDAHSDQIVGDGGNDFLFGGDGNDTLAGAEGRDMLRGGSGRDQFYFARTISDFDRILDFEDGADRIVLVNFRVSGFGEIKSKAREVDGGLVIDFGADVLRIDNLTRAEFTGHDVLIL